MISQNEKKTCRSDSVFYQMRINT